MRRAPAIVALLLALAPVPAGAMDLSPAAVTRGGQVFQEVCRACHGLRYLGIDPHLPPEAARSAFGRVPPDLSLITRARGRGTAGAAYVERLLGSYVETPERNSLFPGIAMPEPFGPGDPTRAARAADVAAYLYWVADPRAPEREALGVPVLGYMALLTLLLFLLNRRTWKRLPPPAGSRPPG